MKPTLRSLQALGRRSIRAKTFGFIGLGRMGSEMAFNLFSKKLSESSDSSFVVCDAIRESVTSFCRNFQSQFAGTHVDIVQTPEEVVYSAGTVLTMLPSSSEVQAVYAGPNGIMSALQSLPGHGSDQTLLIDSTTLDVGVARRVASEVTCLKAHIVDAPVSGGVTGAKAGTLSFLVGGTESAFQEARPTLTCMGKRIVYCGGSGAGLSAKICNNLVLGVQQIVVAEAMLLGQKLGLDPAVLAGVINSATGSCWASSVNNPVPGSLPDKSPPCERDYEGGFNTSLMLKDMGLATDIASTHSNPLPLGEFAHNLYSQMLRTRPDLAKKDFSSIYQYLQGIGKENTRGNRID